VGGLRALALPDGVAIVGDWTGTGQALAGSFAADTGVWHLDLNGNGAWDGCAVDRCVGPFGQAGDTPVVGDWQGAGFAMLGVFDPQTGLWELDLNNNGKWDGCRVDRCLGPFGKPGDLPVVIPSEKQ
jgi:hypothetical protein